MALHGLTTSTMFAGHNHSSHDHQPNQTHQQPDHSDTECDHSKSRQIVNGSFENSRVIPDVCRVDFSSDEQFLPTSEDRIEEVYRSRSQRQSFRPEKAMKQACSVDNPPDSDNVVLLNYRHVGSRVGTPGEGPVPTFM